jgi:hypothetical protein
MNRQGVQPPAELMGYRKQLTSAGFACTMMVCENIQVMKNETEITREPGKFRLPQSRHDLNFSQTWLPFFIGA